MGRRQTACQSQASLARTHQAAADCLTRHERFVTALWESSSHVCQQTSQSLNVDDARLLQHKVAIHASLLDVGSFVLHVFSAKQLAEVGPVFRPVAETTVAQWTALLAQLGTVPAFDGSKLQLGLQGPHNTPGHLATTITPAAAGPTQPTPPTPVQGTFVRTWGSQGTANGQFHNPAGVAVSGAGEVYVTDYNNNRVQVFRADGTFVRTWGSLGTANGQFNYPVGVAVSGAGEVYVADYSNNRVQV